MLCLILDAPAKGNLRFCFGLRVLGAQKPPLALDALKPRLEFWHEDMLKRYYNRMTNFSIGIKFSRKSLD
jgi:hypothetical protein